MTVASTSSPIASPIADLRRWAIVDPILQASVPLHEYEPGSAGPPEAERLVADVGGWLPPAAAIA